MQGLINDFLAQKRFAVVGSFKDDSKFAYKIVKMLIKKGYEVFPVNPSLSEVEGRTCYKSIDDISHSVDVVSVVTPPSVTEKILKQCLRKGIKKVWLQPGTESFAVFKFCRDNGIQTLHNICLIEESFNK